MKYRVKTDLLEDMGKGDEISSSWRDRMIQEGAPESWFEPVEQVTEGQYWKWKSGDMFRIESVYEDEYGIQYIHEDNSTTLLGTLDTARKLSTHEIEQALIKEAKRRGLHKNKFRCAQDVFTVDPLDADKVLFEYFERDDELMIRGADYEYKVDVYDSGNWAEIVDQTPHIEINGYEAEFCDGHVKFGCATINMGLIKDLYRTISSHHKNNDTLGNGHRKVQQVKIGNGMFTVKDLKQIAEYYE